MVAAAALRPLRDIRQLVEPRGSRYTTYYLLLTTYSLYYLLLTTYYLLLTTYYSLLTRYTTYYLQVGLVPAVAVMAIFFFGIEAR